MVYKLIYFSRQLIRDDFFVLALFIQCAGEWKSNNKIATKLFVDACQNSIRGYCGFIATFFLQKSSSF